MGTTPASKSATRVLSASFDAGLNRSRALLLRDHGFDVETSESLETAHHLIENRKFDVLIFGSTLPSDACWTLGQAFRKHHAAGKIIEILPSPWAAPRNRPDATVVGSDEQAKLVAAIRETARS